ncbi:MAG: hypothetical protein CVT78_13730 [Alphaproteobacteria bacterium HGW-Alphaproteobacteria-17]|nr:MAG: hypothetical protein CVT78_13730 [Alphaproteobacteria bacterium HGW-Alphaproteobacteria-17]
MPSWRLTGPSLAVIALCGAASEGRAQETGAAPVAQTPGDDGEQRPAEPRPEDRHIIIVNGQRVLVTSIEDEPVEQVFDEDALAGYAASTLGELIARIREDNGDRNPALLVNGQPVNDPDDIADLPIEAVQKIETLPQGSAQRLGGNAGQRAYNIVLRPAVRSVTLTASREQATEKGWSNSRGEALFTYIKGQDRINLTVRGAQSTTLLESERDFIPRTSTIPFSPLGNLLPFGGAEIDPELSALAGFPVTVAGLPVGNSQPTLADLVQGANRPNPSGDAAFRSLRGSARPIEVALAGNKQLAPWLSLSFNGRLSWSRNENLSGLPTGRFQIPALHPLTPFDSAASIAVSDVARPLRSDNEARNRSLSATLNGHWNSWRASVTGRWEQRRFNYLSQFSGPLVGGANIIGPTVNPFDGSLASLIPVNARESLSKSNNTTLIADAEGPVFRLWAGSLRARVGAIATWTRYRAEDISGIRSLDRREYSGKLGVSIPLTSRANDFLPALGDSEMAVDVGRADFGRFGTLNRHSIALNWQLKPWLRVVASELRDERALSVELLSAPEVVTPNISYFDPVTGDTVDVTAIYGGAGNLRPEDVRTRSIAVTLTPLRPYSLQIDAEYSKDDLRNQIGALPPPSAAIVAAFPDRFQRDASGMLVLVDNRSVNFLRQRNDKLRLGLRFTIPLSNAAPVSAPRSPGERRTRTPPLRLQFNLAHTLLLESRTVIRDGLPEVDLLKGGAVGLAGSQQRHLTTGSIALTQGANGVRIDARRRGSSKLIIGTLASPDRLDFGALATVNVKAFADLSQAFPRAPAFKGTRITVAVDNLFNERQNVTNLAGNVPQAYQPIRRDPVGRTVLAELRKVF